MERYDVIVVGSGPAGLSAAITLKVRNKSVVVFGNTEVSEKVSKAHEISNYLGVPKVSGKELAAKFYEQALDMGVEIVSKGVFMIYPMGEYFSLSTKDGDIYEASSVILATGVSFGKAYAGEEEFLGRGVSYCATCDAPLYRDKKVVIVGASQKEESEAEFMAEIAAEVIYIPTYKDEVNLPENIKVVRQKPLSIQGEMMAETLVTDEGEINTDGIFILRDSVSPAQLVPGLAVEDKHIAVNRKMETSIQGCFAAGDATGAPYQYIKAAGEGNVAALSAVDYLKNISK